VSDRGNYVGPRHVLVTQCLQNDFFLNPECRLCLPEVEAKKLLVSKEAHSRDVFDLREGTRRVSNRELSAGPLGVFLEAVVGTRLRGETPGLLHVINIRDWHVADDLYAEERRRVGRHCEAGSWGADYVDGFHEYLNPAPPLPDGRAAYAAAGNVRIYHVHSDSLSDFRPRLEEMVAGFGKNHPSSLERLLDVLLTGSDEVIDQLAELFGGSESSRGDASRSSRRAEQQLGNLGAQTVYSSPGSLVAESYVAVIGVHTDVKVATLLDGLKTRYNLPHVAVSDTLCASRTLERHLLALDTATRLQGVEVIHGLGDLAAFLGTPLAVDESRIVAAPDFRTFRTLVDDKKRVVAHQNERLQDYVSLTRRRSIRVYEAITRANIFLMFSGCAFLLIALASTIANIFRDNPTWQVTAITGGLGIAQIATVFFSKPMREMQQNLNNLASFTMVLEGRALKQAFAEFHLTTPEVLREITDETAHATALAQIDVLRQQLDVIDRSQLFDYEALGRFAAIHPGPPGAGSRAPDGAATDGAGENGHGPGSTREPSADDALSD
jgi:hypothetical protein